MEIVWKSGKDELIKSDGGRYYFTEYAGIDKCLSTFSKEVYYVYDVTEPAKNIKDFEEKVGSMNVQEVRLKLQPHMNERIGKMPVVAIAVHILDYEGDLKGEPPFYSSPLFSSS